MGWLEKRAVFRNLEEVKYSMGCFTIYYRCLLNIEGSVPGYISTCSN